MQVALYPGCTAHSTGKEYSQSMHAAFSALGIEFTELDDWNCCGGAAAHCLSELLGLALPARNVAQAEKQSLPLAIPCPGCFNAVKRATYALENDPAMKTKLEDLLDFQHKGTLQVKTMLDIVAEIGLDKIKAAVKKPLTGLRVVSYYGCALVRDPKKVKMGDHENPMFMDDLVTALGGEAVDWSYKVDCCGADLAMTHGKIAKDIADTISAAGVEADADCMMTSCGLCQVNLDLKQTGTNARKLPVLYFSELMGLAMDLQDRDEWWDMHIVGVRPLLKAKGLL